MIVTQEHELLRKACSDLKDSLISSMTQQVVDTIVEAGYTPEEVATAYIIKQAIDNKLINPDITSGYSLLNSEKLLPNLLFTFSLNRNEIIEVTF